MRSIERRYNEIKKKNPYWSSYICFCETIRNKRYGEQTVAQWFNKLVDIDDYDKKEKREIIHFLKNLSRNYKSPEGNAN